NVIDFPMMDELATALQEIESNDFISVIVLRGAGDHFSAGVDIPSHTPDKAGAMLEKFHRVIRQMAQSRKVLIAEVRGNCLGGGAELALMCDIVYTTADARWGFPEIQLACFPPVACAVLAACVGQKRAAEMVLTGTTFSGKDAVNYGLANWHGMSEQVSSHVIETVLGLTKLSAEVLPIAKRALYAWDAAHFEKALAHAEAIYRNELVQSKDMEQGIRAWMERRATR
ncbi:MAG TPA: enoyl-CoA hydratase/isomerase family protein, partial [Terriglobales bacterium]